VHAAREIRTRSYKIHNPQQFFGNPHLNQTYFHKTINFPYKSGRVFISGNPEGTEPISFSHSTMIYATYPSSGSFQYSPGCGQKTMQPIDITQFLTFQSPAPNGVNVTIKYQNKFCSLGQKVDGTTVSFAEIGQVYIVNFEEDIEAPDPFLRLPWNYESKGLCCINHP